ncbi:MAG TPA: pyrroline-5-carboxylate reductase [Elusimicrobiota bacterium]|nr:pyrroline-5-carboxylate reductase [Elusimicrobiota bacterium]
MLKNKKIAVIGAGHMGEALIGGMVAGKLISPKDIVASRRDAQALASLKNKWGIRASESNAAAAKGADIILLTLKPQAAAGVLGEIAPVVDKDKLVISVMAGITTAAVNKRLKKPNPVVRAMPNTPALVNEAATALCAGAHAGESDLRAAEAIFKSVGKVEVVPENLLDAVTGLSGSGPVYIYMVIEAMTDGGVKMGIPRAAAARLAAQTVYGAAKLVLETGKHPAILKDEVTTPGGTAIAAIHELESKGLRTVLMDAVVTATKRSKELSEIYG